MQRIILGGSRIFAAVIVLATAACGHKAEAPPPVVPVVALPVHPDGGNGGSESVSYPVEVTARYSNTMSFRVPGKLIKRNVRLGDSVKEGQVIAQLDPVDAQKQLASAKASLDAAEHRLVYAQQQLDRDKAQSEANLIAANQLEQTQDSYTAALAGRDQAAAQLVVARNNLEYNTLIADHDGLITSENADTGQVVAAGQAVYGLAWNGDTDVILDAAESYLGRIAIGQAAKITFPALPGRQYEARVREIAPAADPQSRTFRVKLQMTGTVESVRLGMTGDATLLPAGATAAAPTADATATAASATKADTGANAPNAGGNATSAFTLPATAIFHQDNHPAVWVVTGNDSTLQLRAVQVSSYTDHSSVVTAGLHDGDIVVLAGVHTVYAGQHVKPVRPLFDGEGNVDGPAPATPPPGASRPAPATPAAATTARAPANPAAARVAATQSSAGAQ
ncbi:MAG: efflux RND transporter periplasmic adaptor subunit [Proteobacteria bacterium]|nr:efflux RND transporter periplasmic adaptor subunit [Pseudomonadota bacterium]